MSFDQSWMISAINVLTTGEEQSLIATFLSKFVSARSCLLMSSIMRNGNDQKIFARLVFFFISSQIISWSSNFWIWVVYHCIKVFSAEFLFWSEIHGIWISLRLHLDQLKAATRSAEHSIKSAEHCFQIDWKLYLNQLEIVFESAGNNNYDWSAFQFAATTFWSFLRFTSQL